MEYYVVLAEKPFITTCKGDIIHYHNSGIKTISFHDKKQAERHIDEINQGPPQKKQKNDSNILNDDEEKFIRDLDIAVENSLKVTNSEEDEFERAKEESLKHQYRQYNEIENEDMYDETENLKKAIELSLTTQQKEILPDKYQKYALQHIKSGKNVLITGGAGTGKSVLIDMIIKELVKSNIVKKEEITVSSTTGISALNVKGDTIQKWSGIHACTIIETMKTNALRMPYARTNWRICKILIIDEISMLNADQFDALNEIAIAVKKRNVVFGGVQVILIGDFYQLPPVKSDKFVFDSKSWNKVIQEIILLKTIHRQNKDESQFIKVLSGVRDGSILQNFSLLDVLRKRVIDMSVQKKMLITTLVGTRKEAERINQQHLRLIGEKKRHYISKNYDGEGKNMKITNKKFDKIFKDIVTPYEIILCKGALIIFTKNTPYFSNGEKGVVERFKKVKQIRKSKVKEFLLLNNTTFIPVVKSLSSGRLIEVYPEEIDVKKNLVVLGKRFTLPLLNGWAITIHKSQGMEFDEVYIVGSSTTFFAYGQFYVALSRCKNIGGLYLSNFELKMIKVNPKVAEFYKRIQM